MPDQLPTPSARDLADQLPPVPMVRLLDPHGVPQSHPEYSGDLDPDVLCSLWRDMALARRLDLEATALQRQGELGLWAGLLGQEAAQIGSARALAAQDVVFPSYREHGVLMARGVDPVAMLGVWRGVALGGWDPVDHNVHLYAIVIGSQVLHAAGYAVGVQRDGAVGTGDPGRDTAVVAYFGDGATAQGDVSEAFVVAAVEHAPVVFFCQNNQFAISEPNERQSATPLYRRAAGFGFPGVRVDGNDVVAVRAVTRAALDRARRGEGPTLIEAFTYRMGPHTTADDPTRYRDPQQLEHWRALDPILRVRRYLEAVQGVDAVAAFAEELDGTADALAERVRAAVRELPDPPPLSMFDHVHAAPHAQVDADRAWFAEYLASAPAVAEVAR